MLSGEKAAGRILCMQGHGDGDDEDKRWEGDWKKERVGIGVMKDKGLNIDVSYGTCGGSWSE